jgi:uncharacterized OB-fold protein
MTTEHAHLPFANLAEVRPSHYTAPFWAAAREHRLVCQRCAACGSFRMPPAPACWACTSVDDEWIELPGTGTVYTHSTISYSLTPEIRPEDLPYVVVVVALDGADDTKYVANLVGSPEPSVGMRVRVGWHDVPAMGSTIPVFLAADACNHHEEYLD